MNTIDIGTLGSLAIVGVFVSILIQFLKTYFSNVKGEVIAVGVSILAGLIYFFLQQHNHLLVNIVSILASADVIYSYVIKKLENKYT